MLARFVLVGGGTVVLILGFASIKRAGEMKNEGDCQYWQSKVDSTVMAPEGTRQADTANPQAVQSGIECLLRMEGNQNPARFSGAVNNEVSQIFPHATAEVAALYYVSYLYRQKWEHADAVALRDEQGEINTPRVIREAYKSYRKWFEKVKRVGLVKARAMKLEPLKDTKVHWY